MKEKELRENAVCIGCSKKIMETFQVLPMFYRVTVEHYMLDMKAIKKQSGLEAMLGSVRLAQVMGTGEDLAKKIAEVKMPVCTHCMSSLAIAELVAKLDESATSL